MGVTVGPGATIAGRYRLESPIGAGGFGAVFRATDLQSGSPVAVKVLMEGAVESGARFKRESELAMRLSHPNTVRTHDAGEDPAAGLYMVLELLEGGSLEQVLRARGGFGPGLAAEVALAVLGSLGEAHALGIVHRDIKPANVFLRRAPLGGVKVLDFGIAKSTNEGTRAGLTREGQTIGTPAYMAPEQVKGGELGPETDLYALGLVLAEAISGKPVYATNGGLAVLVDKLRNVEPPLPAEILGSPLEHVVRRATQHHREDRYRTAEEMSRAVEAALAAIPDSGHRHSSMRASSQVGGEWGTESMPMPSPSSSAAIATAETYGMDVPSSSTGIATAETYGMQIPSLPPFFPGHSSYLASHDAISSAPTAAIASMNLSEPSPGTAATRGPAASAATESTPAMRASTPSGPAFSEQSHSTPFASRFALPFPEPRQGLAAVPKKSSRGLRRVVVVLVALVALVGVGGLIASFVVPRGPNSSRSSSPRAPRRSSLATNPGAAPSAPPTAPAAVRPAMLFACAALHQVNANNLNSRVNGAPGFTVVDQSTNRGGNTTVEMTMRQNGVDAGRLTFIDGASPGVLQAAEAARRPDELDAVYALRGPKFLYITLSLAGAKDLLPSLCGG